MKRDDIGRATLPAAGAAGAITRLLEMGAPAYMVSSAVIGILAQRLIRFGGWDGNRRTSDTWELAGAGWRILPGAGPSGRNHAVLVTAPDRGSLLLYGGHDGDRVFGDLWERRRGRWVALESSAPAPRVPNGH